MTTGSPDSNAWKKNHQAHAQALLDDMSVKYALNDYKNAQYVPDAFHAALAVSTFVGEKANMPDRPNDPVRIPLLTVPNGWTLENSAQIADTAFQLIKLGREKLYFDGGDLTEGARMNQLHPQVSTVFSQPTEVADLYVYSQLYSRQQMQKEGVTPFEDMVLLCKNGKTVTGAQLHKEAIGKRWQAYVSQPRGMGTLIK